jgi:hypothetical protein
VRYLLEADGHIFVCRGWDALVNRLVWAHGEGYKTAKARCCGWENDRPLMPSECAALVEEATAVARLRLVETQPFRSGMVLLRYRTA